MQWRCQALARERAARRCRRDPVASPHRCESVQPGPPDAPVLPTPQIIVQDERLRRTRCGGPAECREAGVETPARRVVRAGARRRVGDRGGRPRDAGRDRRRRRRPAPRQLPVPAREGRAEEPRLPDRARRRSAGERPPRRRRTSARGRRRRADPAAARRDASGRARAARRRSTSPIVHEDDALLVVDKPAGVAVHGGSGISFGVIEQLRASRPDARFLELVHRLDRETSGLLLVAKTPQRARRAARRVARRTRREALRSPVRPGRGPRRRRQVRAPLVKFTVPTASGACA